MKYSTNQGADKDCQSFLWVALCPPPFTSIKSGPDAKNRAHILHSVKNNANMNLKCKVIILKWSTLAVMEKMIIHQNDRI